MKSHYRAVVIGGGVVGASVLYHLARFGWSDVALIERAELTAGSTWHAAAGFHALNADPNVAALQDYTIKLYREIEAESGQNAGLHMTGGVNMASDPARWEWLKSAWAVFQSVGIETAKLVTPEEIKEICPIADVSDVLGGLYDSNEGHLDPYGTTHAYAGAAKKRGADVILRNRVLDLKPRADGGWDVLTEQGTIIAEHVVNAGGLWAKQVGRMAGVELPVTPMEHHYFITEDIPEVAALDKELGLAVDLDGFSYLRQERKGVLLGVYEQNPKLAPMLGHDGRLKGDLTVFNWGDGQYWIMGSYYLREFHMRWFEANAAEGVTVTDPSDIMTGFLVTGPNARAIVARTTHQDVSGAALPFMACGAFDIGMVRARVARLSIAGEVGFEINCPATMHATLRETLLAAGEDLGLAEIGFYALNALRLEKSFGIWSREFTQAYTPGQTGLDRFIAFSKGDFIGREAALKQRNVPSQQCLVTLEIDAVDADASGFEPVWHNGRRVGFVTSGGYGYAVGKSLALALVDRDFAGEGTALSVHIVGIERPARVIPASPYDPQGEAMRQ